MIRYLVLAALGLALFFGGLATGRLTMSPEAGFRPGSLPGDDPLEQAWENFLQSQRAALSRLRDSEFYGDDQERAEAYYALLQDIRVAVSPVPGESAEHMLLGELPVLQPPGLPLTPNGMASVLEGAADTVYQRAGTRLARSRRAFESASNGFVVRVLEDNWTLGMGHWNLDNDQALIIEMPAGAEAGLSLSVGNVWAMALTDPDAGVSTGPDCKASTDCRVIVSHRDPQLDNWLDTGGHRRGLLLLRWRGGDRAPVARLVRFDALGQLGAPRGPGKTRQHKNGSP